MREYVYEYERGSERGREELRLWKMKECAFMCVIGRHSDLEGCGRVSEIRGETVEYLS